MTTLNIIRATRPNRAAFMMRLHSCSALTMQRVFSWTMFDLNLRHNDDDSSTLLPEETGVYLKRMRGFWFERSLLVRKTKRFHSSEFTNLHVASMRLHIFRASTLRRWSRKRQSPKKTWCFKKSSAVWGLPMKCLSCAAEKLSFPFSFFHSLEVAPQDPKEKKDVRVGSLFSPFSTSSRRNQPTYCIISHLRSLHLGSRYISPARTLVFPL